jgi:hypothetical protein
MKVSNEESFWRGEESGQREIGSHCGWGPRAGLASDYLSGTTILRVPRLTDAGILTSCQ